MFSFGWWSTGRDQDAINLFETVRDAMDDGVISGRIAYCFLSRKTGEGIYSDRLAECCREADVPVHFFSAVSFKPELRKVDREKWRDEYHHRVLGLIGDLRTDTVVLAGYMWVVSPEVCNRLNVINLHPAAPSGPSGTWQEVIWRLIEQDAAETGAMMHLVTPELDKGPPVTFCRFPIKGGDWDRLWEGLARDIERYGYEGIKERFGETYPLFARIRAEGVKRELPLIVHTLRSMADGDVIVRDHRLVNSKGEILPGPFDLTEDIDAIL